MQTELQTEAASPSFSPPSLPRELLEITSGEKGIRTPGTLTGTPDFESGTFGLSVISPPRNLFDRPHPCQAKAAGFRWFSPPTDPSRPLQFP